MVVKRFFISISVLFFYALLLQAKNEVIDHGQFLCSYYYCYSKDTIKNDEKAFLKSEYNYFHNQNSIDEATSGISLGLSDEKRNYDLIERE